MIHTAKNNILKKSYFDEKDGVKILHIKGTPYEMGYQHGYLFLSEYPAACCGWDGQETDLRMIAYSL
jgi:hypothetical protein